jgi:hypothetical protein
MTKVRLETAGILLPHAAVVYGRPAERETGHETMGPLGATRRSRRWEKTMLETIAVVLIILWLLGFVTSYTMGGFIHILLVVAVIVVLLRVIQGRRL